MEIPTPLPQSKQCSITLEGAIEHEMKHGRMLLDPTIDWKKLRRTVSNRLSAQRSRIKTVNYTRDLEKMVKDIEELIFILTPQVESYKEKNTLLQLENDCLQKELEARSKEARNGEMALEEKKAEIKMLKGLSKTETKNDHASGSEAKETPEPSLERLKIAKYPGINLYQTCLQNQQQNARSPVVKETATDLTTEQSGKIKRANKAGDEKREYEDVDQYINFDALCPVASVEEN